MNKKLKFLSGVLSIAMLAGSLAFTACAKTDDKPIDDKPIDEKPPIEEPVIPPEDYVYNEDGTFNQEGFLKAFNEVMDTEMKAEPQTYNYYLNSFYSDYDPMWIYYDKEAKAIKLGSFGKYKDEVVDVNNELWTGEFRLISFPIDIDACETWPEFKEKFVEEVTPDTLKYELFVKYDHEIGSGEYMQNKELDDALIKLSRRLYNQLYKDYAPSAADFYFFGTPYEINGGDRVLAPIGTLFFNDKNQIEFIGSEVWVSTEGGWENNIKEAALSGTIFGDKLNVYPTVAQRQVVCELNDTFCDLMNDNPMEKEVTVQNGYKFYVPSDELVK